MNSDKNFVVRFMGVNNITNPFDCNTDVEAIFEDGKSYIATFFTLANIISIMECHTISGESLSGRYFWASDMIIAKEISIDAISAIIAELVSEGTFHSIFRPKM